MTTASTGLVAQLVARRKTLGITQAEVAAQLYCCRTSITQFERECTAGRRSPTLDLLQRYAAALGAQITIEEAS